MMYPKFMSYLVKIKRLSQNGLIQRGDILNKDFLMFEGKNIKEYYAPFDYTNPQAKVMIVGITPGWEQTKLAYESIIKNLNKNLSYKQLLKEAKYAASFEGQMRQNLIKMLDEIRLNYFLSKSSNYSIQSTSKLFEEEGKDLLHATSVFRYPIMAGPNNKNYSGYSPSINYEALQTRINRVFYNEVKNMKKNPLIIPLGKMVSKVMEGFISKGLIGNKQCLIGFPHPSGANAHREEQYNKVKNKLNLIIKTWLK